jgi:hypothetical protein
LLQECQNDSQFDEKVIRRESILSFPAKINKLFTDNQATKIPNGMINFSSNYVARGCQGSSQELNQGTRQIDKNPGKMIKVYYKRGFTGNLRAKSSAFAKRRT